MQRTLKSFFCTFISCLLVIGSFSFPVFAEQADTDIYTSKSTYSANTEVKGVWISFLEMQTMLTNKTQSQFTSNINTAFENVKNMGLNTVIVQVRPYGDALYASDYFPWSYIATGTEGKNPGFDPLQIMVDVAKQKGLRIEAWINPYRVRPSNLTNKPLTNSNPAAVSLKAGDRTVIEYNGTISYNPASTKAQTLIVNGIREIIANYKVDGIHIDDYFYPTTDTAFDKVEYSAYQKSGGNKSLADWRRGNVESLLSQIYNTVKAQDKNLLFGISPQSNLDTNYNTHYLDVKKIVSNTGYCDYVCPQVYFGFQNQVQPFAATMDKWGALMKDSKVDLYVGLASYKIGTVDNTAGAAGKNEWVNNSDLMSRMVSYARQENNYKGFVLYRYDFTFVPSSGVKSQVQKENSNLKAIF